MESIAKQSPRWQPYFFIYYLVFEAQFTRMLPMITIHPYRSAVAFAL